MARSKGRGAGKEPATPKVRAKAQGRLVERATNLVAVLFALSLAAERVVGG